MKEGKLISCVPKGKGKNGPNLSCFSILPDPSVSVPLDPGLLSFERVGYRDCDVSSGPRLRSAGHRLSR